MEKFFIRDLGFSLPISRSLGVYDKSRNMKMLFRLIVLCFSLSSCEKSPFLEHNYLLKLTNKSSDTVVFELAYEYPDLTFADENSQLCVLAPKATAKLWSEVKWKDKIESLPSDTLILFAIDVDTYNTYGYDKIRMTKNFIAFKKISVNDLQYDAGGEISYP